MKKLFIFICTLFLASNSWAGSFIVTAGSNLTWTKNPQQTKIWKDTVNNYLETCVIITAPTLTCYGSTDGVTWSVISTVALDSGAYTNGGAYDVVYDGTATIFVTYATSSTNKVRYIRGAIANASPPTITWSANTNVIDDYAGTIGTNADYAFSAGINGSNKVLVLFNQGDGGNLKMDTSTNTIGTSFADSGGQWGGPGNLPASAPYVQRAVTYSLAGTNMVVFQGGGATAGGGGTQYFQYCTEVGGAMCGSWTNVWSGGLANADGKQWGSTKVSNTAIYLLSINNTSTLEFDLFNGTSIVNKTAPAWPTSGIASNGGIACSNDATNVFCFLISGNGTRTLYYAQYTVASNTWGSWIAIEDTASGQFPTTVTASDASGNMPILYQNAAGDVRFACIRNTGAICSFVVYKMNVTPSTGLSSAGFVGGPFTPSSVSFTVTNNDSTTITANFSNVQTWLTLSTSTCTLAVNATCSVVASINSGANSLIAGTYNDLITFTNATDGLGNTTRPITLAISNTGSGGTASPSTKLPTALFTDIITGPATGNGDGLGSGAIVTMWGTGFGGTQGTSTITIGGVSTDHVYAWGNADGTTCGRAILNIHTNMQCVAFSIPATAPAGLTNILLTTSAGASNLMPFTVTTGTRIRYISTTGNNANVGSYASPWQTLSYVTNGPTLQAGDIIYVMDGVQELAGLAVYYTGMTAATQALPISFIGYPGATVLIQNSGNFGIGNHTSAVGTTVGNPLWINWSKFVVKSNGDGIQTFWGSRIIGNEITQVTCADGQGGAITNGDGGGSHTTGGGVKMFGNYIHDFGGPCTTNLHHIIYLSNRTGLSSRPEITSGENRYVSYEIGWNYAINDMANGFMHNYDQAPCGGWIGPMNEHDNVGVNISAEGMGLAADGTGCVGMSQPVNFYNNLLINAGNDNYIGTANPRPSGVVSFNNGNGCRCTALSSVITLDNNTIVGFPSDGFGFESYSPGSVPVYSIVWKNNILYDTTGRPFSPYNNPSPTATNSIFYSALGSTLPTWDTGVTNINSNPLLVNPNITLTTATPGSAGGPNYSLQVSSPAIGSGSNPCPTLVVYDLFGTIRGTPCDIGAYQYLTGGGGGGSSGTPLSITVSPTNQLVFAGSQGSVVTPQTVTFTITNNSNLTTINGTIAKSAAWSTTSASLFTLSALTSTTFTYQLSTAVNSLVAGTYLDSITVTNSTNNAGTVVVPVALIISPVVASGGGPTLSQAGIYTWVPVNGATGYKVYLTLTIGGATHQLKDVGMTYCTSVLCKLQLSKVFGFLVGTGYYISVSPYNNSGEGAQTPQLNFTYGGNVPQTPSIYSLSP